MDPIHERGSYCRHHREFLKPDGTCPKDLPTVGEIRSLLGPKQHFDNDYSPTDWNRLDATRGTPVPVTVSTDGPYPFLGCACKRADCPRCQPKRADCPRCQTPVNAASGNSTDSQKTTGTPS